MAHSTRGVDRAISYKHITMGVEDLRSGGRGFSFISYMLGNQAGQVDKQLQSEYHLAFGVSP